MVDESFSPMMTITLLYPFIGKFIFNLELQTHSKINVIKMPKLCILCFQNDYIEEGAWGIKD